MVIYTYVMVMISAIILAGKHAAIDYGTGLISGYFGEDNVIIGGIVVKDQVNLKTMSLKLFLQED